jgi:hypothetical protein
VKRFTDLPDGIDELAVVELPDLLRAIDERKAALDALRPLRRRKAGVRRAR